jgi:hypothetical protein
MCAFTIALYPLASSYCCPVVAASHLRHERGDWQCQSRPQAARPHGYTLDDVRRSLALEVCIELPEKRGDASPNRSWCGRANQ